MLDKRRWIAVGFLIIVLILIVACGKKDKEVKVEEINEMNKGQIETKDIKEKLTPDTNLDDLQNDIKEFDNW